LAAGPIVGVSNDIVLVVIMYRLQLRDIEVVGIARAAYNPLKETGLLQEAASCVCGGAREESTHKSAPVVLCS